MHATMCGHLHLLHTTSTHFSHATPAHVFMYDGELVLTKTLCPELCKLRCLPPLGLVVPGIYCFLLLQTRKL